MARPGLPEVRGGALKNGTLNGALQGSYAIIGSPVKGALGLYYRVPVEGTMGFYKVPFKRALHGLPFTGSVGVLYWGSLESHDRIL